MMSEIKEQLIEDIEKNAIYYPDYHRDMISTYDMKEIIEKVFAEKCIWKLESWDSNNYITSCGQIQTIITGSPKENDYIYCCYCGKEIEEDLEV